MLSVFHGLNVRNNFCSPTFLWGTGQKWTCISQVAVSFKRIFLLFLPFPFHFLLALIWRKMVLSHKWLNICIYSDTLILNCRWESRLKKNSNLWKLRFVLRTEQTSGSPPEPEDGGRTLPYNRGDLVATNPRSEDQRMKALCLYEWQQDQETPVQKQLQF